MIILVFDTETTGLPKTKLVSYDTLNLWPYIVQFSYIIFDTDTCKIIKKCDFIVKLKAYNVISEESIKLHGITNEISLEKGENIQVVLNQFFKDYQTVDLIVAHNMEFDSYMIKVELIRLITGKDTVNRDEFDDCLKIISNKT